MVSAPFSAAGWLKMSADEKAELVGPFYPDYLARRAELDRDGLYPYNDSFSGHIAGINPAITGTSEKDEGTAIYLLQQMHERKAEEVKLSAFIEDGAILITPESFSPDEVRRGTVAIVGEYGETGYRTMTDVRVLIHRGRLIAMPKGARVNGYGLPGIVYFKASTR